MTDTVKKKCLYFPNRDSDDIVKKRIVYHQVNKNLNRDITENFTNESPYKMLGKEQMQHPQLHVLTVIFEASVVLKHNLDVGPTAKSEYRPTSENNESRHAGDEEKQELRHNRLSVTRELATRSLFWTPMETRCCVWVL